MTQFVPSATFFAKIFAILFSKKSPLKTTAFLKMFVVVFLCAGFFLCGGCGAGTGRTSQAINTLPKFMLKVLSNGTLRGTLEVYGPDGDLAHQEELQINPNTGEVFSSQFEIKRGFTYSFLVTFFYTLPGLPELPISFVPKVAEVTESFTTITWEETDIIYSEVQISPDISAAFSTGNFPDLDADDDGYSNFFEIREGSDPLDPESIPSAPVLVSGSIPDGQQDLIEFTLTFEDASGVADINPENPVCGYSLWEVTSLDEEGRSKQLHAIFNAHANPALNNITLQISATDILGLAETFTFNVSFVKTATTDPNKLGPEIAILRPSPNETVSDVIKAEAIACDEEGILGLAPVLGNLGDGDSKPERYFGDVNTSTLGDGAQVMRFSATNLDGRSRTREVPILIANGSPIKVDSPASGSDVSDSITLIAHVDKNFMPDVTDLFVERVTSSRYPGGEQDPDFFELLDDDNNLAEAYKQVLNTANFETNERTFTVRFRAVGTSSGVVTREVTYKINNDPDINFYVENGDSFASCITGGNLKLKWEVSNRNSGDAITLNGLSVTNSSGMGEKTVSCNDGTTQYKIEAIRNTDVYKASKQINLSKIGISGLKANQVLLPGDFSFALTGANPETRWKVEIHQNGVLADTPEGTGSQVDLGLLEPRSDYEVVIHIVNEAGLTVSKSLPIPFLTTDHGLVGWWRFNEGAGSVINDYSGNNFDLTLNGNLVWNLLGDALGASFNGIGNFAQGNAENVHGSIHGLTVEALVHIDNSSQDIKYLVSKDGEFSLGFSGNKYQIIMGLDGKCDTSSFEIFFGANPWLKFPSNRDVVNGLHHLAVTFSGTAVDFFIDGKFDSESSFIQLKNLNINCKSKVGINALIFSNFITSVTKDDFQGIVDESAIYNRPLLTTEIYSSCQRLAPSICP